MSRSPFEELFGLEPWQPEPRRLPRSFQGKPLQPEQRPYTAWLITRERVSPACELVRVRAKYLKPR
jgi:hypothetical protein